MIRNAVLRRDRQFHRGVRRAILLALSLSIIQMVDVGVSAASVVTSSTNSASSTSPASLINALGGATGSTNSAAPETPAQKAAIRKAEEQQAKQEAQEEKEDQQARQSLNGLGGRYFLPPLPTPPSVRPMVGLQYQEEFPLSPKEIQWVKQQMQDDQYAIHKGAPLKIVNPSLPVSLGPGAKVPTIHLAPGYVTTISVIGEDGSPWPVTSRQVGGGNSFAVSAVSQDAGAPSIQDTRIAKKPGSKASQAHRVHLAPLPSNLLTISPKYFGSSSNLVLTLKGVSTPVMVNIVADGPHDKTVDGMVTLRVDRHGPDAPPPLYAPPPPSSANPDLMLFLAQTPPKGAKALHASGDFGVEAWEWNHRVVVRTRIPLLSPAWTAEVRQDGVMVYDLPKTRVLMLRDDMSSSSGEPWQTRTVLLSPVYATKIPSSVSSAGDNS
jgi:ribosomal protein L12E/L44/L45/RPP1/RPP2